MVMEIIVPDSKNKYIDCSKFRGVRWDKEKEAWEARVEDAKGKEVIVGYYDCERHAAMARDRRVVEMCGKRAKLNDYSFPATNLVRRK